MTAATGTTEEAGDALEDPGTSSGRPLRVMFIDYGVGFGGSIISLSELVRELQQLGSVDPLVVTFQDPETVRHLFPDITVVGITRRLDYQVREDLRDALSDVPHGISRVVQRLYALADFVDEYLLTFRMRRLAKKTGAEIIHANNGWELSAIRTAASLEVPCVVHNRGLEFRLPRWIGRSAVNDVACYIGISEAVSTHMREAGVPPELIKTILNPVSAETYRDALKNREGVRKQWNIPPEAIVTAVFGRITHWKGQREFLEAATDIIDRCDHMLLMIVGDESDSDGSYFDEIRHMASRAPLRDRVIFTGYQPDVADYFAAADIVVHSSIEPEPFGRVVIEGMAGHNAVIAVDDGGSAEIVTHLEDGWLVPRCDRAALAEAMLSLYNDAELRKRLSDRASSTVERRFSPTVIASQVVEVYRSLSQPSTAET